MYFIPVGIFLKGSELAATPGLDLSNLTWGSCLIKNLWPVTLGNIIGGAIFVGLIYWLVYIKGSETK